jgi:hypothetical protein
VTSSVPWSPAPGSLDRGRLGICGTFVSIMSDRGATIELIADLVGHKDTATTWIVYRHQLRPVILKGAKLMNAAAEGRLRDLKGR